ncbi:MAG: cytochrome d ubiquinol oxidase subunit II [Francisellaceae bacterium]|jgi:cytochrome d ubiquinol oxidase subunit II
MSYEFLQFYWWIVLGIIFCIYASTAGYDLGVTMIFPWIKDENEKRVVLNTSAPVWDGNNTWIIFLGGLMFVVFPPLYATAFSGLLVAMYFVLWSFFLRPVGYDYRGKVQSKKWRKAWDVSLFISSFFPVLIFGVASANSFVGFGYKIDPIFLRSDFQGDFLDLLSPTGIVGGLVSLFLILSHSSIYIARRTEDNIRAFAKKLHWIFTLLFIVFFIIGSILVLTGMGFNYHNIPGSAREVEVIYARFAWFDNLMAHPWKFIGGIGVTVFLVMSLYLNHKNKFALAFWSSVGMVFSAIGSTGLMLFPFIFPSNLSPADSLTLWNSTPGIYTLTSLFYVALVAFIIIAIYKTYSFHALWSDQKTLKVSDLLDKNKHFY